MSTSYLEDHMPHDATFHSFSEFREENLPAEDRAVLGSLSSSEIPAWTVARAEDYTKQIRELENRIRELGTYVATLQSQHNACAPISRLPNEVLMNIFGDFSLNDPRIRRVCRRWRRIVLATPSFWVECLSIRWLAKNVDDQAFLRAALIHAGSRPLSLHLEYMPPELWRTLLGQRGRIVGLTLNGYNDFPSDVGEFFSSRPIESLRRLKLDFTEFTPRQLVSFLKNCPLLEYLWLNTHAWAPPDEDEPTDDISDIVGDGICLPHLKELTIAESPEYTERLLRLFNELPAQTTVQLRITPLTDEVLVPAFDFEGVFGPPGINRVCVEPFGVFMVAKGYAGSNERLRMSTDTSYFAEVIASFTPPASVLILNPRDGHGDGICEELTAMWDLSHLSRLEITHTAASKSKPKAVTRFLRRRGHRAGELSLAWALPIVPGQEKQPGAEAELQALLAVLSRHVHKGNPRLGALELYAVERGQEWEPFTGSVNAGSDARQCSQIVGPFLFKLRELADEVHIGGVGLTENEGRSRG